LSCRFRYQSNFIREPLLIGNKYNTLLYSALMSMEGKRAIQTDLLQTDFGRIWLSTDGRARRGEGNSGRHDRLHGCGLASSTTPSQGSKRQHLFC
jgi:hypothetical protein